MHRTLAQAVLDLEEPYRATLLLRFYRGETPKEIALAEGVPGATVRTRIKRGLEQLRASLDEEYGGDRQQWSSMILPASALASTKASVGAGVWVTLAAAVCLVMGGVYGWNSGAASRETVPPIDAADLLASAAMLPFPSSSMEGGDSLRGWPLPKPEAREVAPRYRGRVLDAETNDPVAGATLTTHHGEVLTSLDGSYELPDLPATTAVDVQVVSPGFVEVFEPVVPLAETEARRDFLLERGHPSRITVKDRGTGMPLEGVELRRKHFGLLGVTDEEGSVDLRVKLGKEMSLRASKVGYVDMGWGATVRDLEEARSITLPITELGWIDVRVVDETGAPVEGTMPSIWFADDRIDGPAEFADPPAFEFPGELRQYVSWDLIAAPAPHGTCTISFPPSGSALVARASSEDGRTATSEPFFFEDPMRRPEVVLTLISADSFGTVEGVATYNGLPLAKARVFLTRPGGERRVARADRSGSYLFRHVAPGQVTVELDRSEGPTVPPPADIEVVAGAILNHSIEWTEALVTMRGTVQDYDGSSAADCPIRAIRTGSDGRTEIFSASTNEEGVFEIEVRAGAPYRVMAHWSHLPASVENVPANSQSVALVLNAEGWIRARFKDQGTGEWISLQQGLGLFDFAWRTDAYEDPRVPRHGRLPLDGTYLFHVAANSPSSTVDLHVHLAEQGYARSDFIGLSIGSSPEDAPLLELPLTHGLEAKLTFQGPETMTNERRDKRIWFLLRDDQLDDVSGPFQNQGGESNYRIGKVNMWLRNRMLMNQTVGLGEPDIAFVRGVSPGRYTLRSFPDDFTFEPEWFDLSEAQSEIELTWSEE